MFRKALFVIILLITIPAYAEHFVVKHVIDGDTLKLATGERVRLIGIDTPERKPNDKAKRDSKRTGQDLETITKMGQEATDFVKGMIKSGQGVWLEFDVQEKDKYGRLLAYVTYKIGSTKDYTGHMNIPDHFEVHIERETYNEYGHYYNFLNATIIKAGYATPMTIPPNVKHADLFKKLYEEAREQKRGLWRE